MKTFVQLALDWLDLPTKDLSETTKQIQEGNQPTRSLSQVSGIADFTTRVPIVISI